MYKQLTREQRYAIYLELQRGSTLTSIAREIGVSISTVSREVKRDSNRHGRYLHKEAHELALVKRERSCANRRHTHQLSDGNADRHKVYSAVAPAVEV